MNILPVSELRKNISSVLKQLDETGEPFFIVQYGHPKAVLMTYDIFNTLMKDIEELDSLRKKSSPKK